MDIKVENKVIYDKCVQCGNDSTEPINRHKDFRNYFIEGAGQLCADCYEDIYGKDKPL